jgi:hypothetical protein
VPPAPLAQTPPPALRAGRLGSRRSNGGRVQVFGCSPGFLLISLAVSVVLTIILNILI